MERLTAIQKAHLAIYGSRIEDATDDGAVRRVADLLQELATPPSNAYVLMQGNFPIKICLSSATAVKETDKYNQGLPLCRSVILPVLY